MEASVLQILFCDVLYLIAVLLLFKCINRKSVSVVSVVGAFVAFALMCLFPFVTGDYFHYRDWFELVDIYGLATLEGIYVDIAAFSPSYLAFRMIVWGLALLLLLFTFRFVKVDFVVALFFFIVRYFMVFSYARASLCMAMIFCGLALIIKLFDRKFILAVSGAALIYFSYYFHRTAIFGIGVAIMSLFFVKQSKYSLLFILVLVPLFVYALSFVMDTYLAMDFEEDGVLLEKGKSYLEGGGGRYSSFTKNMLDIIWRVPFFLILIMYGKIVISGQFNAMPIHIRVFANATAIVVFISLLFLLVPSIANFILYYRFLNFAMIPSTIFVTYCFSNKLYPILVKSVFYISLFATSMTLLFRLVIKFM